MRECTRCELHKTCRSVNIQPRGEGDIVFLGEAPGREEDLQDSPFVGRSGALLEELLSQTDIPKDRIRFSNAVRCRPPDNRTPSNLEIKACSGHLIEEFLDNPPSIIVPLGNVSLKALRTIGVLTHSGTITTVQGTVIVENTGTIILPMFHPAYIMRNPEAIESYAKGMEKLEKVVVEGPPKKAELDYRFSESIDELKAFAQTVKRAKVVAYDIETSCLSPFLPDARILSFALSIAPRTAFGFWLTEENRAEALEILDTEILEDPYIKKIIQHAKFELGWSYYRGRTIDNIDDTMLLHWHVDEKNGTHGLGNLALKYTDMGYYDKALEDYKKEHKEADPDKFYKDKDGVRKKGSYANIPPELLLPYNCADVDATLRVHACLIQQINEEQRWVHDKIQIPSCYPLMKMETNGVRIDWDYVNELDKRLPEQILEIEKKILEFPVARALNECFIEERGEGISFNSSKDLRTLLFDAMDLNPVYQTDTGLDSTDKGVLEYLAKFHEIPQLLLERRRIATLHSNFVVGALERRVGDSIHTSYGQAHTETSRLNSKNPNLQNTPRQGGIKQMFIPDPGCYLLQADYSQIELRIMALFSRDENLLQYFRQGVDIHRYIAAKIHKKPPEEITKEERVKAKRTVFGLCYGQSAMGLASELRISQEEADEFLKKFFKEFPAVKRWMDQTKKSAERFGYVRNMFGRLRRLPDAMKSRDGDSGIKARAFRQAVNAPIQGTAADMLALKMSALDRYIETERLKTRMLLTVHDSLTFSLQWNEAVGFLKGAKQIMEDFSAFPNIDIPIIADFEIGKRWGDLFPVDAAISNAKSFMEIDKILEEKNVKK